MIAIICVWHCVAYGQLPVHIPYYFPYFPYFPYISTFTTFVTQPHNQQNGTVLGGNAGELLERSSPFQGALFVKLKKLEAITANLAQQLKGLKTK